MGGGTARPTLVPYRSELAALDLRIADLEREIAVADAAAAAGAELRRELASARAQRDALRRPGGRTLAGSTPWRRVLSSRVGWVALGLVALGFPTAVGWLPDASEHPSFPPLTAWPSAPSACLNAAPSAPRPSFQATLGAHFLKREWHEAAFVALAEEPGDSARRPHSIETWGAPTLTISAASHATTATPIDLRVEWTNTTTAPIGILEKHTHRRHDAAYVVYAREEASGRIFALFDWDRADYCGTRNTYRKEDVLHLMPAEKTGVDAETSEGAPLRRLVVESPGVYTIWLAYRFCGYGGAQGAKSHDYFEPSLFVGVAVSNAVRVEIVPEAL